MRTLFKCYEEAARIIGDPVEPFEVVENVDRHRRYWRPSKVRFLLLAESHVFTNLDECVPMRSRHLYDLSDSPERFVRFVYCLGYGEPDFVGLPSTRNRGTPQYWKVFASCDADPADPQTFASILKTRNRVFRNRISKKVALLRRLRDHGVWLLDASILALYRPGGGKPDRRTRDVVLSICWDRCIRDTIRQANPEKIIVIGRNVGDALDAQLHEISGGTHVVQSQPQARMSARELQRTYEQCYQVCSGRGLAVQSTAMQGV